MKTEKIKKLKEFETENEMQQSIIKELLDEYSDDTNLVGYMKDVLEHGCASGIWLCYYTDTNNWYDKYENEIEDLLEQYQDECGFVDRFETISSLNGSQNVGNICQEKNLLCWYGYEETIRYLLTQVLEEEY